MQRTRATSRSALKRRARTLRSRTIHHSPLTTHHHAPGFTLVEMLVATALVALIMVLFAEIFSQAVGTMSAQRALANNDQKARTFSDTLRNELQRLTVRSPTVNAGSDVDIEICEGAAGPIYMRALSGRGASSGSPGRSR